MITNSNTYVINVRTTEDNDIFMSVHNHETPLVSCQGRTASFLYAKLIRKIVGASESNIYVLDIDVDDIESDTYLCVSRYVGLGCPKELVYQAVGQKALSIYSALTDYLASGRHSFLPTFGFGKTGHNAEMVV